MSILLKKYVLTTYTKFYLVWYSDIPTLVSDVWLKIVLLICWKVHCHNEKSSCLDRYHECNVMNFPELEGTMLNYFVECCGEIDNTADIKNCRSEWF